MADTTTPVYSFVLPEIDGSDGTWGTKLNSNLTALDGLLSGSANLQNASFTGTASFGGSTGTSGQVLKSQGAGANAIWTDDSNTTYTAGSGLSLTGTEFANTAPDQTVVMNAGSGISVSGTYPTFTVTNSSPDQTVGLTGTGGTTISGTYPNFTINSTDNNTTYTAGTGLTLTSTEFSVTDNGIGALQLNVSGNGTSGQVLQSDGDGSFSWTSAGTGGNETLAQTLALGAVTGGTDISVSSGDNIVMAANSTVDGRDVSVDGAKLDLINQGVATTDSPAFAGLTVDTTTLAVDSTNNRVGIGTTSPTAKLDVDGQGCFKKNYSFASTNYHIKLKSTSGNGISSYIGNVAGGDRMNLSAGGYYYGASLYQLTDGATGMGTINIGEDGTLTYQSTTGATANSTVNPSERMRIDSSGQVAITNGYFGIGTTDTFTLNSKTQPHYGLQLNPAGGTPIGLSGYYGIALASAGAERMRIDISGNVGIGTTSPASALDVNGTVTCDGLQVDGYLKANRLYSNAAGTTGYFFNDSGTRVAYGGGEFYIQSSVPNCFIYATNTYLGNTSGDNILTRGNLVRGNHFEFGASGGFRINAGYGSRQFAYGVRAWARYEMTGTHSFRDDEGFSSVTDIGTGRSRLNFTNTMPNTYYSVNVTTGSTSYSTQVCSASVYSLSTTLFYVSVEDLDGGFIDRDQMNVMVVR